MRTTPTEAGRLQSYIIALVAVAAAFVLTDATWPLLRPTPWSFFFVAVMASAWFGGSGPSLLTVGLAAILGQYFLLEPLGSLKTSRDSIAPTIVFAGVSLGFNLFALARRRAEAFERAERSRFQATVMSIGDGVIATDPAGRVTFLNGIAEELTGWKKQEAVGRPLEEVFVIRNEGTRRPTPNPVRKVLETGRIEGLANHTILVARGGAERPIDDSAAPIKGERGELVGVVLVFRDVTAKHEAEKALAKSAEFNRRVVASSPDCLKVLDLDGRLIPMNDFGCELSEADEFALLPGGNWVELWPEELRPVVGQTLEAAKRGETASFQGRGPAVHGTAKWWDVTISPILSEGGTPQQLLAVARDITGRREADARLARLHEEERAAHGRAVRILESITDAFFAVDHAWRFTYLNPQAEPQLQRSLGDLLGKVIWEEFPAAVGTRFEQEYRVAVAEHRSVTFEEYYPAPLDAWFEVHAYPSEDGLSVYFRDVTDRKRIEQQLRAGEERYRTLFNSIDEGFGVIEMILDAEGRPFDYRFLEVNPAFEGHTGLKGVVGRTMRELAPDLDEFWFETYGRVAATGESVRFVSEAKALEDRWFDVFAFRPGDTNDGRVAVLFNNISPRKRAEEERERLLREVQTEQERLADVFQSAPSFMCVLQGPDHVFERVNDRYLHLVGHRDLLGKPVREALPEVAGQGFFRMLDGVYQTGEAFVGSEVRILLQRDPNRLPEERFVDFVYQPLRDLDGKVGGIIVQGIDLTDRKTAEEELRSKTERLNLLVENIKDYAVVITDPAGTITEWQGGAERITGFMAAEAIGRKSHLIFTPEDCTGLRPEHEMTQAVELGRAEDKRWHIKKDGSRFFADGVMTALFTEAGSLRGFGKVFKDATGEKRAEEATRRRTFQVQKLAEISNRINSAHDVRSVIGVVTEEARNLVDAHQAATSMAADPQHPEPIQIVATSKKSLEGSLPFVASSWALDERNWKNQPIRLTRGELEADPRWRSSAQRAAGGANPDGWLSAPLMGRNGKSMGIIQLAGKDDGEFTDDDEVILVQLSRLAAIAIENAKLYDELRSNDQRKDEFLAMLAHELRNPLAAISNAVGVTTRSGQQEHIDWSMEVITRQMRHLTRLIDDLLDVSRISRGKIQLRKDILDVTPILDSAVATVKPLADERKHRIDVAIERGGLWIDADPTRLEQVVVNLLNNAAKYSENAGQISLVARTEGNNVVITVKDRGVGIPPEKLPGMFELFAQGDRSLARSEGGLGIGLTVVKKLVEMHSGSIAATSAGVGLGSEFTIILPAAPKPTAPKPTVSGPRPTTSKKARILVVDDNVDTARGMARLLKLMGHEVRTSHDGHEALEHAREFEPEIILLDIGLPGMDGYEVASRLRQEEPCKDSLIVAVSGYGQDEDRRRSREAGFDHHLIKPLDHDALISLLATAATEGP